MDLLVEPLFLEKRGAEISKKHIEGLLGGACQKEGSRDHSWG